MKPYKFNNEYDYGDFVTIELYDKKCRRLIPLEITRSNVNTGKNRKKICWITRLIRWGKTIIS